jgi:hypothetical protein
MTKLQQVNNIVIKMLNKHKKLEEGIEVALIVFVAFLLS